MKSPAIRRILLGMAIVIVELLLGLAVLEFMLLPRLEAKLAAAVRRELELPDDARVDVLLGDLRSTLAGYLPAFHVDSQGALVDELSFQELRFDAANVRFNLKQILQGGKAEITSVESAQLTLLMSIEELRLLVVPLLEEEGLEEVSIVFGSNSAQVTAGGKLKMSATGQFYITEGKNVGFKLTDAVVDKYNITVSNLTLLLDDILPPLDLGGMFARVVLDDLQLSDTHLEITAHTEDLAVEQSTVDAVEVF